MSPANPYQAPASRNVGPPPPPMGTTPPRGLPCRACGSPRTTADSSLRPRPSVLGFIFFGWLFLLARGAFSRRTETCLDCGSISRHKSPGSWVALAILLLLVLLIIAGLLREAA